MKVKSSMRTLFKALKLSILVRNKLSLIVSIFGFVFAFVPSIMAVILQRLTDCLQELTEQKNVIKISLLYFGLLVGLFVIQLIFQTLKDYTQNIDKNITMYRYIRERIFRHKCEVKYKYIENYDNFNDRITFAETQAGKQVAASFQNIINILQGFVTFISVTYLLYRVSALIVIVLLLTSIPAAILSYKQKDELYYNQTKWMQENALVLHYYYICSGEHNIHEVRHFGLFKHFKNCWRNYASNYCDKKRKMTIKHVKYNASAEFLLHWS
jgi:ABC-type multidrug transport system fused ATPase/permease subunit